MQKKSDAIIAGGGLVGMSMAIAIAQCGASVIVLEKTSMPSQLEANFDGRVSAIAYGSQQILDHLGVWQHIKPHAEPILDIRVTDGDTPFFLHYDHNEVGDKPFGYIAENRHTRIALQKVAAQYANIEVIDNCSISSISVNASQATVALTDGQSLQCRLLIGADGRQSHIRKLSGIAKTEWSYQQVAIVCTIEHEKPHHGLAQERFLPAGPFAVLPMTGNRSSLVWVEPADRVGIYLGLPEAEFVQEITERVGNYLGRIKTTGPRFSYPLSLMHANRYSAERIALIGDAAHGMHPIAGQGVNLGWRDVAALAELIEKQFTVGMDIGGSEVLDAYQRWRRFDNISMLAVTDMLTRLFSNKILPLQIARDLGMWAVGKMPPAKKLFMRHAMGLVGDLPKILRK